MSEPLICQPIGFVRSGAKEKYELPRQPRPDWQGNAIIELLPGHNFEQALEGLAGFSHIWLLFWFHNSSGWRPKVLPPRSEERQGLFATRSPHRPNPIGLSSVELVEVSGRVLTIGSHDLLDGTPILDIKPYLAKQESHPDATQGWLTPYLDAPPIMMEVGKLAEEQLSWLLAEGVDLIALAKPTLLEHPWPRKQNRVADLGNDQYELACKTWRIRYQLKEHHLTVTSVRSGYDRDTLEGKRSSRWNDLPLHRKFEAEWPKESS